MTTFFTGTRTPQNSDWSVTSTGTGATLYAFITVGSRAEWSPLSSPKTVTYDPTNPDFSITLNSSLRSSGTWVWEIAVAFSPTNNPQDAIFAAAYRCLEIDQTTQRTLPATITFNNTTLIKTTPAAIVVADTSDLTTITPKLHGMIRSVTAQNGAVYRWDGIALAWVPWRSSSAYQFAPRKPANEVNPANDWYLPPPIYPSSTLVEGAPSLPIQYWLVNDGNAEWTTGDGVDLQVAIGNDLTKGYLLSGLCKCRILGLTDVTAGTINTSTTVTTNVNTTYTWQDTATWLFQLTNSVPSGSAIHVEVWLQYYKSQLRIPSGSLLQIIPLNTGKYAYQTPGFASFQDWLVGLNLLPKIGGLSDTGGSAKIGDWQFIDASPGYLTASLSIPADGERQIIVDAQARSFTAEAVGNTINNNGTYRTEGLVGIVKNLPGVGTVSEPVTINCTSSISITLTHPTTIKSNYPVIAGLTAQFNVPIIYVYLSSSDTQSPLYGKFYRTSVNVTPGTQTINILNLGTLVSSVPISSFTHDLFSVPSFTLEDGTLAGSLPSGQVDCRIQYAYPSPNTAVSVIEMSAPGMLQQRSAIIIPSGSPTTLLGYGITDGQPLNSNLTAISALTTTAFGRGILTQLDAPAVKSYIGINTSFDGTYNSLSNPPTSFPPSSHNQAWSTITSTPTTLSGYGITDGQAFITAGTTSQYYRGDKTFQTLDKTAVGLSNVVNADTTTTANISDSLNKRFITDAQQTLLTNISGTNTGDQSTFSTIAVAGQSNIVADSTSDTLTLVAGSNITLTTNATNDEITIASTGGGGSQSTFSTIAVAGQSDIVADSTSDTLTLVAGSNITLTTNATNDEITIASTGGGGGGGAPPTVTTLTATSNILTVTGISTIVRIDTTSNNVTATLPTSTGNAGYIFWIKRISGGTNLATINTTSSQTIDGQSTAVLTVQYEAIGIFSNGTNWEII